MSTHEIIAILLGLAGGYWGIGRLLAAQEAAAQTPWHLVLNVAPDATLEQVDQAYQSMMKTKEVRNAYAAAIKALTM
ncbi:hypothetical protein GTP41_16155 [Pseudoduganella sp. DS3]|uniref:J domain-containing protein n=1 Tax=Pseudoduganella guangdongensis TaxID=2692179 RepID=A0A6N9HJW7_9BURK|nr:hypothetical protein [Pseudoduganella guangdongensis]MYN03629.1 hypothetical protein [Pseudoduganella guangdongensis]